MRKKDRSEPRDPLRGNFGEDVRVPTDPKEYRKFEAAVLGVVPGRTLHPEMTTAQRHYQLRFWAGQDAWRRHTNTVFLFWKVCGNASCKRATSCAGDPHACFLMIWPHVDEDFKFELRALAHGLRQGLSKADAFEMSRVAFAEHKRYEEQQRQKTQDAVEVKPACETASATISHERPRARVRLL